MATLTAEGATPTEGATCFFCSPTHSWVLGKIDSLDEKETYTCTTRTDGTQGVEVETCSKIKRHEVFVITNMALLDDDPDDLLMLTLLHDSTLMHSLNMRYFRDVIYTNIGPIVVAFNPFKFTIPWYQEPEMKKYLEEDYPIRNNKPHSWAVAHNTYHEMIDMKSNQCVLVSGESGAGKTEAVKIVMRYLSAISVRKSADPSLKSATEAVGFKLLQASPILEGFGNAKTVRNDNSSRFGKFMKVQFDGPTLVGAHTIKYLLEKSRIVTAGPGERCYHSFYYLCDSPDASKFKVQGAGSYKGLSAGNCLTVDGVSDAADYAECMEAFKDVGVTDDEKECIWRTVGGVLNMLNVEFKAIGSGDSCEVSGNSDFLKTAAELWQVPYDELHKQLLSTTSSAGDEVFTKQHTTIAAADTRDSLVKAIYDELFDWLVNKLNTNASVTNYNNWIGLLDIFGFEDFKVNSFEQLCINLANETLQHHYNTYIFNKDIEECKAEGVDVTAIHFPDNTPCLKLITDKMGIIALLDEECALGKGTDQGFLSKVIDHQSKHPFFEMDRLAKTSFKVKHYAATVSYEVANFLDKNRDTLKDDMKLLIRSSADPFVGRLLPEPVDKKGKKITVGGFFRDQLHELMDLINSTNPHWIRCIKPHPAKKPLKWHGPNVFNQLSSSGIIGTVKVRKAGFPIRMRHMDFLKRFRILKPGPIDDPMAKCREIIASQKLDGKRIQTGTSRVFMKNDEYWLLESAIATVAGKYVAAIQAYSRGMVAKVILGEKDFEKNKSEILAGIRATMVLQIEERKQREQLARDAASAFVDVVGPELLNVQQGIRAGIEEAWERELLERVEKEGAELRRIQKEYLARVERQRQEFAAARERMEESAMRGCREIDEEETSEWDQIMAMAGQEQGERDECRNGEKAGRRSILEEENAVWGLLWEEERESYCRWKDREEKRLASEWKGIMEDVFTVQHERKAAAVAEEKYRADARRREQAETRRRSFTEASSPKGTAEERKFYTRANRATREQAHNRREENADAQVESLRDRKEMLMGPEAARSSQIARIRSQQAIEEQSRKKQSNSDGVHDSLSQRIYPSERNQLNTAADPPPPYLFSQVTRSTAEEIMVARSPVLGGPGSPLALRPRSPHGRSPTSQLAASPGSRPKSPMYRSRSPMGSPAYSEGGVEGEPLFSPVRTRAAAGMDEAGNAYSPMLPQPNPVSPPALGSFDSTKRSRSPF